MEQYRFILRFYLEGITGANNGSQMAIAAKIAANLPGKLEKVMSDGMRDGFQDLHDFRIFQAHLLPSAGTDAYSYYTQLRDCLGAGWKEVSLSEKDLSGSAVCDVMTGSSNLDPTIAFMSISPVRLNAKDESETPCGGKG